MGDLAIRGLNLRDIALIEELTLRVSTIRVSGLGCRVEWIVLRNDPQAWLETGAAEPARYHFVGVEMDARTSRRL